MNWLVRYANDSRNKALETCRRLLALVEHPNTGQSERDAGHLHLERLKQKHNITNEEIRGGVTKPSTHKKTKPSTSTTPSEETAEPSVDDISLAQRLYGHMSSEESHRHVLKFYGEGGYRQVFGVPWQSTAWYKNDQQAKVRQQVSMDTGMDPMDIAHYERAGFSHDDIHELGDAIDLTEGPIYGKYRGKRDLEFPVKLVEDYGLKPEQVMEAHRLGVNPKVYYQVKTKYPSTTHEQAMNAWKNRDTNAD